MGTASSTIARSMEMAVKSWREPRMASLISANHRAAREGRELLPLNSSESPWNCRKQAVEKQICERSRPRGRKIGGG